MDEQRRFHVLICKEGDCHRLLAVSEGGYTRDRWYKVRVVLDGAAMTVYVDGKKDLEAVDRAIPAGKLGLYAWGCAGAKFRAFRVNPGAGQP